MSTINELLNSQRDQEQKNAGPPATTQNATGNSTPPDDPCCTPPGADPGPDR